MDGRPGGTGSIIAIEVVIASGCWPPPGGEQALDAGDLRSQVLRQGAGSLGGARIHLHPRIKPQLIPGADRSESSDGVEGRVQGGTWSRWLLGPAPGGSSLAFRLHRFGICTGLSWVQSGAAP